MTVYEEIKQEGRQEGISQGIAKVAVSALRNGIDIQTVAKFTGLDLVELEKLNKSLA